MNYAYRNITELLASDTVYQELEQQRQESLRGFRAVMEELTGAQRDAIVEYIGISEDPRTTYSKGENCGRVSSLALSAKSRTVARVISGLSSSFLAHPANGAASKIRESKSANILFITSPQAP